MTLTGDRQERAILKRLGLQTLILVLIAVAASLLLSLLGGNEYTKRLTFDGGLSQEGAVGSMGFTVENLGDDTVSVLPPETVGGVTTVTLRPLAPGRAFVTVTDIATGAEASVSVRVTASRQIIDLVNGNSPHWQVNTCIVAVALGAMSVLLWCAFRRVRRIRMYSYLSIFFSGFGVWVAAAALRTIIATFVYDSVLDVLSGITQAGERFMLLTLPFCLVFSVAMIVSNISLIRHEGMRRNNLLGIGLGGVILLGQALGLWGLGWNVSGSEMAIRLNNAGLSLYTSLYVMLECFLIGAMICGALAAKHEPADRADYIIILGCAIRRDGTLPPLVRGRVDRALDYGRRQQEQTGSLPVFVPSGGQGRNEVCAEAEAMARYLREQGIPEDKLLREDKSVNTAENMRFSRALIEQRGMGRVLFSTTNYHVFRSGIISRQAGLQAEGMGSRTKWYYWPNAAVRQLIGMLVYLRRIMLLNTALLMTLFVALNLLVLM